MNENAIRIERDRAKNQYTKWNDGIVIVIVYSVIAFEANASPEFRTERTTGRVCKYVPNTVECAAELHMIFQLCEISSGPVVCI